MKAKNIYNSFRLRSGVTTKNRVVLAPLTNGQSHDDGTLSDAEITWLARRAAGGFGTIISCAAYVNLNGKAWAGELGVSNDEQEHALKRLNPALQEHSALGVVQLFHGGAKANPSITQRPLFAPSAFDSGPPHNMQTVALDEAGVYQCIDDYVAGAIRCQRAGMGGVEIHGANGYLITQFLSNKYNLRLDQWGGTLANRARMIVRIIKETRRQAGSSFVVGLRISPEFWSLTPGGPIDASSLSIPLSETLELIDILNDLELDYLHLSLRHYKQKAQDPRFQTGSFIISEVRDRLNPGIALMAAGGIVQPLDAQEALDLGLDLVALGTAGILNPDWPSLAVHPSYQPQTESLSPAALANLGLSPPFIEYLRKFGPRFVKELP